ncbi:MAG TPA: UDP-N-acetylmuramate dehydrogenase [Acidobacteriaceae bacterium]|nr:UDP-N-acetylmuramate dehydrogenase [Acidobacteriaceae bacterium]
MNFLEDLALAPYTSFRIGGPARWFAEASTEEEVLEGVSFARKRGLPLFILGGGSNLLVSDQGFPGLVLHIALPGIFTERQGGRRIFRIGAGESWDGVVARAVAENCAGVECLSGIPGSAGAAPVQNIGAYGQEVSQTILEVRVLDLQSLQFTSMSNADCRFAYRQSVFNSDLHNRFVITRADFSLEVDGSPALVYEDLKPYFKNRTPSLAEVREAVLRIRQRKGMLIVPGEPDSLSAGSFFKNPIVSCDVLDRIAQVLDRPQESIPRYPAGSGKVKLPAAWLLEQAGFSRGYSLGQAAISSRHTLALVNRGHARAADIIALRDTISSTLADRFGIRLEPEPVWIE